MSALLSTLLFAGAATAQMTTAFPFPKEQWGTDKIGLEGSVIGVSNDRTTYAVVFDDGTDTSRLALANTPSTLTLGTSYFGLSRNVLGDNNTDETEEQDETKGYRWGMECSMPASATPTCSEWYGPVIARNVLCGDWDWSTPSNMTQTVEYSARSTYSAGVETIVKSVGFIPSISSTPDWCSQSSFTPTTGWTMNRSDKKEDFATYQLVVTAGLEKLSATKGASGSPTTAGATGGSTGAASPMKTIGPMGPVVAGLGAAAAFFL
ncbi:hypothetical protein DE146DRAFT_669194 [Phaeosphaeria sp. MPI-PUGE-AT-0046c]|nr:hypothetical protein DE146DRAFT_669194 [Phaeosphaeria sp. MPI-PUGE-AT-0046c]